MVLMIHNHKSEYEAFDPGDWKLKLLHQIYGFKSNLKERPKVFTASQHGLCLTATSTQKKQSQLVRI